MLRGDYIMKKLLNSNQLKPSKYNYILNLEKNERVIYNTKTGAIDLVDQQTSPEFDRVMNSQFEQESELVSYLIQSGYLVDKNTDEESEVRELGKKYNEVDNVLKLILLPAEICNFACPYCFIYTMRDRVMKKEVYDATYKKIASFFREMDKEKSAKLEISWYGGEPTLASNEIVEFMNKINELKASYSNIILVSNIVTNGYLLNYDLFRELYLSGIGHFQVTLDGDEVSHDKLRFLEGGKPTFRKIYENLMEISRKADKDCRFSFKIRANFTRNTVNNCKNLLEMFLRDFGNDSRFEIYFRPVYNFETDKDTIDSISSDICGIEEGLRQQNILTFIGGDKVYKEKVTNPLPRPIFAWCDYFQSNTHIIGWDGAIFSCDTLVVDKEKSIGMIDDEGNIVLNENSLIWSSYMLDDSSCNLIEQCLKCKRLPVCMGGCKRTRIDSGKNPCYWTDEIIYEAMREYADMYTENTTKGVAVS